MEWKRALDYRDKLQRGSESDKWRCEVYSGGSKTKAGDELMVMSVGLGGPDFR